MARDDDDGDGGTRARGRAGRDSAARVGRPGPADFGPDAVRRPSRSAADGARRRLSCQSGHPSSRARRTPHMKSTARGKRVRVRASPARTRGSPLGSARIVSCCRTSCEHRTEEINIILQCIPSRLRRSYRIKVAFQYDDIVMGLR